MDHHTDYSGQGVDQLQQCVDLIKDDPTSRRIVLSAWNAADLGKMALPSCHCLAQFYVSEGRLSCQMYQRSADLGLGVPFNIASYALLTHLVASVCELEVGEFVHVLGDTHVYNNHVEALGQQVERAPLPLPTLTVRRRDSIDAFVFEDLELSGYHAHSPIKMQMAV